MPFAAALSQHPLATHAVGEVVGQVLDAMGDRPDAVVLFVTGPFAGAMEDIAATIRATLRPGALIGATASSVLAGEREVEHSAAISLFAMSFAAKHRTLSRSRPAAVRFDVHPAPDGWRVSSDTDVAHDGATLLLLADPHTFPVEPFVEGLAGRAPGLSVVGGLASASGTAGGNRLVVDDQIVDQGAVGLFLPAGVAARTVVSQGCQPVGQPLVVTKSSGSMIEEIAGLPALDRLMAQAEEASPEERNRMARSLQVGVVLDEHKVEFEPEDFLIRPVLGADKQRGAIAVGAEVAVGTTIQFQVRDAESADEDLRHLLADATDKAALVFSCTGRGTNLFGHPHHDAVVVSESLDRGAVAGMFCAGEIGPVGNVAGVHAMSASILLLDDGA